MSEFGYSNGDTAESFAKLYNIDIKSDQSRGRWITNYAKLALVDETGSTDKHITKGGADYLFSQIDYFTFTSKKALASRKIARITAGQRTELAYWTKAAPAKQLSVHQGEGTLVISRPEDGMTKTYIIDAETTPEVTLQPGRFYTFEASESLVVSGFYEIDRPLNWDGLEITIEPGQETLQAPDGLIRVPTGLLNNHS